MSLENNPVFNAGHGAVLTGSGTLVISLMDAFIIIHSPLVFKQGGNAVEAVCAAVMSLENNPVFNAGYGAVLTDDGTIEMDALIMDGRNLGAGIKAWKNEISQFF